MYKSAINYIIIILCIRIRIIQLHSSNLTFLFKNTTLASIFTIFLYIVNISVFIQVDRHFLT